MRLFACVYDVGVVVVCVLSAAVCCGLLASCSVLCVGCSLLFVGCRWVFVVCCVLLSALFVAVCCRSVLSGVVW